MRDPLPAEVVAADKAHRPDQAEPTVEPKPLTDEEPREVQEWRLEDIRYRRRMAERERVKHLKRLTAENMLTSWARAHAKRDEVIRAADAAGVSVHRIHKITGVARTTITRILTATPR